MKKEDIHLTDIKRILLGDAPAEFLFEVFVRSVIVYFALLLLLRLLGKRMDGQITIIELVVIITFGAIVAVGVEVPDRGVLQSITALLCILIFHRGINWLSVKNSRIEKITQGEASILIKDGIMQLHEMKAAGMTRQNIFVALRGRGIFNLGKVQRMYFESCGLLSVYEFSDAKAGLAVLPEDDNNTIVHQLQIDKDHIVCRHCGFPDQPKKIDVPCTNCGEREWVQSVK
jgi:uncharacterized membrane protein YcaP (DUF421 family)